MCYFPTQIVCDTLHVCALCWPLITYSRILGLPLWTYSLRYSQTLALPRRKDARTQGAILQPGPTTRVPPQLALLWVPLRWPLRCALLWVPLRCLWVPLRCALLWIPLWCLWVPLRCALLWVPLLCTVNHPRLTNKQWNALDLLPFVSCEIIVQNSCLEKTVKHRLFIDWSHSFGIVENGERSLWRIATAES